MTKDPRRNKSIEEIVNGDLKNEIAEQLGIIRNRAFFTSIQFVPTRTPWLTNEFNSKKPDVSYLRPFGYPVWVLLQ